MGRASLESAALAWMRFWQGAPLDTFDAVHAPGFVDHSPAGRAGDRDGLRQGILELHRAFPDFEATVRLLAVDEASGLVAIRWSAVGHMRGSFLGAAPAGQRVSFTGIETIRVQDGQVVERWGEWDERAILDQIGRA